MKNPIVKSNIRRPLKGILLLIILLVASNLFISSISQLFIVNREIDNISRYFRSVGTITYGTEYVYDEYGITKALGLFADEPMIASESGLRETIGLIDGMYRTKRKGTNYSYRTGDNTLDLIFIGEIKEAYKSRSAENIYEGSLLATKVTDILAGIPDFIESDIMYKGKQEHHIGFLSHSIVTGEKNEYINDDVIDELYNMEPGKKYLFRTHLEWNFKSGSFAKPLYEGGPLYIELDDNGYIDWDKPEFRIIKEEMDFINENIISFTLTGTEDMTGMLEVQDGSKDFFLVDGRWIDNKDNENQNHVIIINEVIADMHEISIGDMLEIKMRDSEYGSVLSSEKDKKEWRTYPTSTSKSFEVVGIFGSKVYPISFFDFMFIPESTIPMELGRYTRGLDEPVHVYGFLYSFVLKNAEDESEFIEKYREPIEEMGLELRFVVNNVKSFLEASAPIKRSSAISFGVFSVLLILMQGFVVYIYIDGHKLNYAIERALGIPSKVSGSHLIQPLIIPGMIASVIGGYIGYNNAIEKSMELLENIPSSIERTIDSGLGVSYFIIFTILSIVPFMIMLLITTNQLKNSSVIDLINNNKGKKKTVEKEIESFEMVKVTTVSTESSYELKETMETTEHTHEEVQKDKIQKQIKVKNNKKSLRRFSLIHILRSKATSILMIVLAGIFTFSLLWMNYLFIKNNDIIEKSYTDYIITGDIIVSGNPITDIGTGPISGSHIDNLIETGFVEEYKSTAKMIYYELYRNRDGVIEKYEIGEKDKVHFYTYDPKFIVEASNKPYNSEDGMMNIIGLNLLEEHSLGDFNKEYTSDYSNQMNPKIVNESGDVFFPILVSNKAMDHFDLELGDKILLKTDSNDLRLVIEAYGTIVGSFEGVDRSRNHYGYSKTYEDELFIYPISVLKATEHKLYYSKLEFEFKPEKNKELMEKKEEIRRMVSNNPSNEFPTELILWDGELINVVEPLEKNLSLLEIFYPLTFILSIIISGILAFMMILRRTLDVAILRILGVKNKEVQWNLFRENLILVLIGIIISCTIVFGITVNSYSIGLSKYVMVMGGYLLGTIVGLILGIGKVTNKKPLDMLQVKE